MDSVAAQRPRAMRVPALMCLALWLVLGFAVPAAHASSWTLKGTAIDSQTKEPAAAIRYMVFEYDAGDTKATTCESNWTESDGRFSADVHKSHAIIYFHGPTANSTEIYRSEFAEGAYVNTPLWSSWDPPDGMTISLSGAAKEATRYHAAPGDTRNAGDVQLTPTARPYGAVSGQVTVRATGCGMPVDIYVWRYQDGTWTRKHQGETLTHGGDTKSGNYNIMGTETAPLTGDFKLEFSWDANNRSRFYPDADTIDEGMMLHVEPGTSLHGVNQSIPMFSNIKGRVIDGATGKGIPNADVYCYQWAANAEIPGWWNMNYHTDKDGYYVLGNYGLRDHLFRVGVFILKWVDHRENWKVYYYGQARTFANAWDISIPNWDIVDNINITVGGDPSLEGDVVDPAGDPSPDLAVTAYRQTTSGWAKSATTYTDQNGKYKMPVSKVGTYTVSFRDTAGTSSGSDDIVTFNGGASSLASATPTHIGSTLRLLRTQPVAVKANSRIGRVTASSTAATAIKVSDETFSAGETTCAILVGSAQPAQAACAAGLAGVTHGPILFTSHRRINKSTLKELARLGVRTVYVIGNGSAISRTQDTLLRALGFEVVRISGADDYEVSANVAAVIGRVSDFSTSTPVFIVNHAATSDALVASPVAYRLGAPILFVKSTGAPSAVRQCLSKLGVDDVYVIGDKSAVPASALAKVKAAGTAFTRVAGSTLLSERAAQFVSAAEHRHWAPVTQVALASTSDLSGALAAAPAVARDGGVILFSARSALPRATTSAIKARHDAITSINAFARTSLIGASTLIKAGSQ